jgi:uncharacterized protein
VGLWAFVSVAIGTIYPAIVQQFQVGPNEYAKEAPYIARNIAATRDAFGLNTVATSDFNFTTFDQVSDASAVVDANKGTINNARLWDPSVIGDTYHTLQNLQTYYLIGNVDVDRYLVDNQTRQVLIAARNLNSADLPSQSFVNRHIAYTHGYGVVASPSNETTTDGSPHFYLQNIPTESTGITLSQGPGSQIYFGEGLSSYVLTGAQSTEFNYQTAGKTDQFTRYHGKDGVSLSNIVRRAAFALRFGDINPLISGQVTSHTKLLMERDIGARVSKLAPFLHFDADPYPVVLGDRTVWILDGYTATSMYPYAQSTSGGGGLATDFNYVRNSVKATIDAYDGTVTFYVFDPKDPIIRSWRKAFPDLFTDASQMPTEIRAHLRFPEDLFTVQSNMFGRYHVTEPRRFYDASAKWLISPDPGSGVVSNNVALGSSSSGGASNQPQSASSSGARIPPYYLYLKLPGDTTEHFIIVEPFVPVSSGNSLTRLVSFFTATSDPSDYGKLQAFTMPQGVTVLGPVQVDNEITRTQQISQAITLLSQQGSAVISGSLQLIPVGNSIVYVRPFYVRGSGGSGYPKFQFVAVYTQGTTAANGAVCAQTVNAALDQLFGNTPVAQNCGTLISSTSSGGTTPTTTTTTPAITTPGTPTTTTTTPPAGGETQSQLITDANNLLNQAKQVLLSTGDLGQYQTLVNQAQAKLQQAQALAGKP